MLRATAGAIVLGCSTLAPNRAIWAASSYEMRGMRHVSGQTRGSVVRIPSTSVQISTLEASSAEAIIDADQSEPPLPSTVPAPCLLAAINPWVMTTSLDRPSAAFPSLMKAVPRAKASPTTSGTLSFMMSNCGSPHIYSESVTIIVLASTNPVRIPRELSARQIIVEESNSPWEIMTARILSGTSPSAVTLLTTAASVSQISFTLEEALSQPSGSAENSEHTSFRCLERRSYIRASSPSVSPQEAASAIA